MEILIWCLTALLLFAGLVGCVLPILPGTTLILGGIILHKLLLPEQLSWFVIGWIALFWLLSVLADFAGIIVGSRLCGGSKWGMTGAGGGAFVGMFFSLPALLLGTFLGAVAAEKFIARKSGRASLKSGVGATVGYLLATAARVACALVMLGLFLAAALNYYTAAT